MSGSISGYDYGNARLRAMRSRLLSRREVEALAEMSSVQDLISALLETAYCKALEAALTHTAGLACIDEALRDDLIEKLRKVRRFFTGSALEQVRIVFQRYDVHNVKAILRGQAKAIPRDEILLTLLPLGELSEGILDELIRAPGTRPVIDVLATMRLPIAQPLLRLRAEHPGAEIAEMDLALERWYFSEARRRLREMHGVGVLSGALDLEADLVNLLTALRFVNMPLERQMLEITLGKIDLQALFVSPGRLPLELLAEVGSQTTLTAAVEILASTPYAVPLQAALKSHAQSSRLSAFEKQLRRYRLHHMAGLFVQDPLGIGVLLGYLALKVAEISNIRWIAQAIKLGLNVEAIKGELEFAS